MCWNVTTSFVTLGIGTLCNVLSFFILKKQDSEATTLVLAWQYALLMQIPEGVAWIQIDNDENIEAMSRLALLLNVTQPFALYLALYVGKMKVRFKYAQVALFMYVIVLLTKGMDIWSESEDIRPLENCTHLNLGYWDGTSGTVYVFASLFVISETPIVYWAVVNALIFLISLGIAGLFYTCGLGSMWCWIIFASGPILVLSEFTRKRFCNILRDVDVQDEPPIMKLQGQAVVVRERHYQTGRHSSI